MITATVLQAIDAGVLASEPEPIDVPCCARCGVEGPYADGEECAACQEANAPLPEPCYCGRELGVEFCGRGNCRDYQEDF